MKWFASDLHLGQHKILEYTPRGRFFDKIEDHDATMIEAINSNVAPSDELFLTGDLAMAGNKWRNAELISRIKCKNIHLVTGNHDHAHIDFYRTSGLFASVQPILHIVHNKRGIIMYHYPIAHWQNAEYGTWHLHGHFHGDFDYAKVGLSDKKIMDVGIDALAIMRGINDPADMRPPGFTKIADLYRPISFDELAVVMAIRYNMPDRHGKPD